MAFFIPEEVREEVRRHALQNASRHGGKAQAEALLGAVLGAHPEYRHSVKDLLKAMKDIASEVNRLSAEELRSESEKLGLGKEEGAKKKEHELPPLPGAVNGKVVTAYPPEPSKYPHIGHAYSILVNSLYAKMYRGKFILRFEDTNPRLAKKEHYESQMEGYKWLGVKPDELVYASDYIPKLYDASRELIERGEAYICTCPSEKTGKLRREEKPCECRSRPPEENSEMWEKMVSGKTKEGEAVLRIKIDMAHKNAAMRDPTIMRIIAAAHPRTGKKYSVWPTYVFQTALLDAWGGVTHRCRSKEFELWKEPQVHIQKLFGFKPPWINEYARLNLQSDVPSSGRKIRELIEQGKLSGWDDPRLTTLSALKKRGFSPEGIRNFVMSAGISKTESTLPWEMLYSANRKVIDREAERYSFVKEPVAVTIRGIKGLTAEFYRHPDFPENGKRTLKLSSDTVLLSREDLDKIRKTAKPKSPARLKDLCNVVAGKAKDCLEKAEGGFEKGMQIVQWVPEEGKFEADIVMPDAHITKGFAEPDAAKLKEGEVIQFVRFGFCRLNEKRKGKAKKLVFYFTHP